MSLKNPKKIEEVNLTSVKSNSGRVAHTINLDWLEFMLSGILVEFDSPLERYEYEAGNIVLAKDPTGGTRVFKYTYQIYVGGKLFAKAHFCPRHPEILKADCIQMQIENNVLYEVGAIQEIRHVLKVLHWSVLNVTRVDIALDGVEVLQIMDRFVKGEIEKLGKAKVKPYFTGKRIIEGFDVGSRSSNKWITGYNKTLELEQSNKPYIKQFWERSGLDTSGTVQRLELKLRNEELKKLIAFDWRELDNFEYLASIFRSTMKNFFEFVEKGTDSNVTRKKKIEFISWDFLGAKLLDRLSTQQTSEVYRMKQAAKTNFWCYLASGFPAYKQLAFEQAMNVNALDWYAVKQKHWIEEFNKRSGMNKDGLISFQYLLNFQTYEPNLQLKLFDK